MAISQQNVVGKNVTSGTTCSPTPTSTTGSCPIAVGVMWAGSASVSGITDNKGGGSNTYTAVASTHGQSSAGGNHGQIWQCANAGGGVTSLTITMSATISLLAVSVYELSGGATSSNIDTSNNASSAGANPVVGPALTTTTANCWILFVATPSSPWSSFTAPYTQLPSDAAFATMNGCISCYHNTTGTVSSEAASVTCTSSATWGGGAAAFKPAAAGGRILPFHWDSVSGGMQNLGGGMQALTIYRNQAAKDAANSAEMDMRRSQSGLYLPAYMTQGLLNSHGTRITQ
ncbi:hypothetical protein BH10PLA2_BH10PLA2_00780 [soil metagenome]